MWPQAKVQNSLDNFRQEILGDPALEQRFAGCNTQADAVDLALALAQQRGYHFSRTEVEEYLSRIPVQEMSDAELAEVGGGARGTCRGARCSRSTAATDQMHQMARRRMLLKD